MTAKILSDSLAILLASPSSKARRAAMHLVCAQVVKAAPIPSPEECDAETLEINENNS
jgi:hypothetical protein